MSDSILQVVEGGGLFGGGSEVAAVEVITRQRRVASPRRGRRSEAVCWVIRQLRLRFGTDTADEYEATLPMQKRSVATAKHVKDGSAAFPALQMVFEQAATLMSFLWEVVKVYPTTVHLRIGVRENRGMRWDDGPAFHLDDCTSWKP